LLIAGSTLLETPVDSGLEEAEVPPRRKTKRADFGWFLASESMQVVVAFASVRLISQNLSTPDFGRYGTVYSFVSFGIALCASWPLLVIAQSVVRDGEDAKKVAHSTISYLLLLAGIGVAGIALLAAWRVRGVSVAVVIGLAAAELFGSASMAAQGAVAQSVLGVRYAAICRILLGGTRLAALAFLAVTNSFSLLRIGIVYTCSFVLINIAVALWLRTKLGFVPRPGRRDPAHLRRATAFMGTTGAHVLTEDGDKAVMGSTQSFETGDVANYYLAYRFTLIGALPLNVMVSASHAEFVQKATKPNEHIRRAVRYTGAAFLYGCCFSIGVYLFGSTLLRIAAPKYVSITPILRWLSLLVIIRSGRDFAQNALLGLGRIQTRFYIGIATTVLALAMYLALIPKYSWKGALIATLIAEVFTVTASWLALVHYQRVENRRFAEADADVAAGAPA
jgi:O-antigen/teichoic acid export membrane protein